MAFEFEKLASGKVLFKKSGTGDIIASLRGDLNILKHPNKPDVIIIEDRVGNTAEHNHLEIAAANVLVPSNTGPDDLIRQLSESFFFRLNSGDKHFTFTQAIASTTWNVAHNLGKKPSIVIVDTVENELEGEVRHTDLNNLVIMFNAPFSGKAYCN